MSNLCTVNRAFYVGDGIRLESGMVIDADTLPLGKQLISQRWLAPAPANLKRCLVTRPFRHGDIELKSGDMVDASKWPNAELMINQRFLTVWAPDIPDSIPVLEFPKSWGHGAVDVTFVKPIEAKPIKKRGRGRPRKLRE